MVLNMASSHSKGVKHRIKWEDVMHSDKHHHHHHATKSISTSNQRSDSVDAIELIKKEPASSWIDQVQMIPNIGTTTPISITSSDVQPSSEQFNVVSWNVLAEQYLTPRSHPNLPKEYADVVFNKEKRRQLLLDTFERFCSPNRFQDNNLHNKWDVLALQELDLHQPTDPIIPALESWGYQVVKTSSDQRKDCCAIAFDSSKFKLVRMQVVQFDDLATMKDDNNNNNTQEEANEKSTHTNNKSKKNKIALSELTGLVRSFLRRNCALIAHLESIKSNQSFIVTSAHLYWNPGYEYVKLCQAKYLLDRVHSMATSTSSKDRIPTIFCGDMNSKPGSMVHQLFSRHSVDARVIAPWRYFWNEEDEEMYIEDEEEKEEDNVIADGITNLSINAKVDSKLAEGGYIMQGMPPEFLLYCREINTGNVTNGSSESNFDVGSTGDDLEAELASRRLNTHVSPQDYQHSTSPIPVKYICDYTLNKFTRWLRILGLDVTLETEAEEKERTTTGGNIALFEHCKRERRTLLTTSYKLLLRKDCPPGAYLLDPKSVGSLEKALPKLLITHGVKLKPCQFLTRCVVCNGNIIPVLDDNEKRSVFQENGAPPDLLDSKEDMEVFRCDGCRQGYWWDDRPSSSASRVFSQATKLFKCCLQGGVEVDVDLQTDEEKRKEIMGAFDFINVRKEQGSNLESELTVIRWLRDIKLSNPYQLRSVYKQMNKDKFNSRQHLSKETIQFTNVTSDFVGLLDYVFFEPSKFEQVASLHVPTSLRAMNYNAISGGHLLPSNEWPSDHLAVGARFVFKVNSSTTNEIPQTKISTTSKKQDLIPHPPKVDHNELASRMGRCGCGCVPNILSLHEMAALRKKLREEAKAKAASM